MPTLRSEYLYRSARRCISRRCLCDPRRHFNCTSARCWPIDIFIYDSAAAIRSSLPFLIADFRFPRCILLLHVAELRFQFAKCPPVDRNSRTTCPTRPCVARADQISTQTYQLEIGREDNAIAGAISRPAVAGKNRLRAIGSRNRRAISFAVALNRSNSQIIRGFCAALFPLNSATATPLRAHVRSRVETKTVSMSIQIAVDQRRRAERGPLPRCVAVSPPSRCGCRLSFADSRNHHN